ncbi:MAG TPA: S41 family peptidase [Bacteroidales bacterium]|jgi:carboxyl-terminal processing protease|nr:S41 family peptidase [Bacteroidales bacterium]
MKKLTQRIIVLVILLIAVAPFTGIKAQQSQEFEISKNLDIFVTLYKELNTNYVDDINASELMQTGIDAMLDDLDPYTVYIPEAEIEDYRFMTTGEYGGIGSLIHQQDGKVVISEPYENSPAQKAGLRAGDRLLKINDKTTDGKSVDEVSSILKGQPGTPLKLEIERAGNDKPLTFNITREKIVLDAVPYYGMLNDQIGYIKLTSFTQTASAEVKKALLSLKQNTGLKGLVLDLRDNGGGLLTEAVNIVSLFVNKGELVVSTKGKQMDKNKTYRTTLDPVDANIPLVVMVNGASASASEIVSGALQDLDRAVIVGRNTYGKGLVQNIFPLTYNTQVKITVAKYYIPSGRCIQAIDYAHKDDNGKAGHIPDSLITAYKTQHGRTVYDGKGIAPDIDLDTTRFSAIAYNLFAKYLIFDFATKFASGNPQISPAAKFEITDDIYNDFKKFVSQKGFEFTTLADKNLADLQTSAEAEGCWEEIKTDFDDLKAKIEKHKAEDIDNNRNEISQLLKLEIVSRYYYQKGRIESSLSIDKDLLQSIKVINDQPTYTAILDGSYAKPAKQPSAKKI